MVRKNKLGFTLTEILICVAILAILAVIAIPVVSGIISKSNEKSDKLNASLYTSYMTKYANESPKPESSYTNLSTSEKDVVSGAGKDYFPGTLTGENAAYYSSDEELWAEIRKQAIVALKMYGEEIKVLDNYLLESPKNSDLTYIYYYVKGTITVEKLSDVQERTARNIANGHESVDNYWVALDKVAGNANTGTVSTVGNVFVKLYFYGMNKPLPVGFLSCDDYEDIYLQSKINGHIYHLANLSGNYEDENILHFKDIPEGEYQLYVKASNITNFPSTEYSKLDRLYTSTGSIIVSNTNAYTGRTISNPYVVYLLSASHGNVQVFYKTQKYNNDGKVGSDEVVRFDKPYTLEFYNGDYNYTATYVAKTYQTALYGNTATNPMYLPLMPTPYRLKFTANGYKDYVANVMATTTHGIYDEGYPSHSVHDFSYDIYAVKKYVTISGFIEFNNGGMPLSLELSTDERQKLASDYNVVMPITGIDTKVYLVSNGKTYTIDASNMTQCGESKYFFSVDNVEWSGDGTAYDVYYANTFYGMDNKQKISNSPIIVKGYDISAEYTVDNFIPNVNAKLIRTVKSHGVVAEVKNALNITNIHTGETYQFINGQAKSIPAGFYDVQLIYPQPYNSSETVRILICEENKEFVFEKVYDKVTLNGVIRPYANGQSISNVSSKFSESIALTIKYLTIDDVWHSMDVSLSPYNTNCATYTVALPLALKYEYSITIPDNKCFLPRTEEYIPENSPTTITKDFDLDRTTDKNETAHRDFNYDKINDNSHSVTCKFCGLQLNNHTGSYEYVTRKGDCNNGGEYELLCSVCNFTNGTGEFGKRNHNYGSWQTIVEPTCYSDGKKTQVCQNHENSRYNACSPSAVGYENSKNIDKVSHKPEDKWTVEKRATCTENGNKFIKCIWYEHCNTKTTGDTVIPNRGGHNWSEYTRDPDIACDKATTEIRYCLNQKTTEYDGCSESQSKTVEAPGHKTTTVTWLPASCCHAGVNKVVCSVCHAEISTKSVAKLSHEADTSATRISTTAATCTSARKDTYPCKHRTACPCGDIDCPQKTGCGSGTKAVNVGTKLGHAYTKLSENYQDLVAKSTCTTGAIYYKRCSRCDVSSKGDTNETHQLDAPGHTYQSTGYVDATCQHGPGYMGICSTCGYEHMHVTMGGPSECKNDSGYYTSNGSQDCSQKCKWCNTTISGTGRTHSWTTSAATPGTHVTLKTGQPYVIVNYGKYCEYCGQVKY